MSALRLDHPCVKLRNWSVSSPFSPARRCDRLSITSFTEVIPLSVTRATVRPRLITVAKTMSVDLIVFMSVESFVSVAKVTLGVCHFQAHAA